jgi:D-serine deaminase-like pyridoxal phosphate-dependent protein
MRRERFGRAVSGEVASSAVKARRLRDRTAQKESAAHGVNVYEGHVLGGGEREERGGQLSQVKLSSGFKRQRMSP